MSDPSAPTNPNHAPRELGEKARSASLSPDLKLKAAWSPISQLPSTDFSRKRPIYLRQPPTAERGYADGGEREFRRTAVFGVASRFAAAAVFVAIVALLFIVAMPALRKSEAGSTSPGVTGSTPTAQSQATQTDGGSKPALSEFQGLLASIPDSKPPHHEQSPELLQRFLQWRQKANSTDPQ